MSRGYCGQCGEPYDNEIPCKCQKENEMSIKEEDKTIELTYKSLLEILEAISDSIETGSAESLHHKIWEIERDIIEEKWKS